jgi:hypothetical protein
MRNNELIVAVIAVASGVLAASAGASPTGSSIVDVVLVAASVAIVTWLAASAPPIAVGSAALAAGAFSNSIWLAALGVAAFAAAFWVRRSSSTSQVPSAVLGLVALNIAARSSLDWFLGSATVVAVVLAIFLALIGLRYRGRRTRLIVAGGCALYCVAAVVGTATTALAGQAALDDLREAEQSVDGALDFVLDGDTEGARESLQVAITSLSDVDSSLSSPLTAPAAVVPVVAQHRRAAAEVSRSAGAAITLLESELDALDLDAIVAQPGAVDLDAVRALERPLEEFQLALRDVADTIKEVRDPWLVTPVDERLDDVEATIDEQAQRGDTALEVVRAVPGLLGADSPRTYFVAFTTATEVRALGGFMGNYAEVTADNGRVEVSDFGRHESLQNRLETSTETSVIDGPAGWLNRYSQYGFAGPSSPAGTSIGTWQNITLSPDMAATGEVIAQLYPNSGGRAVDGVFVADIKTVTQLLDITGPVATTAGVTLDADNGEAFLLNGQYEVSDRPERIDLLEDVSRKVIDELLGGSLPPPQDLIDTLGPMVEQGRLAGWAAETDEQSLFETIGLTGGFPVDTAGDVFAVTFNNSIGGKLDYFLRARASYDAVVDAETSSVTGTIVVELENREPPGPQPDFVMSNSLGLPRGYNQTWVSVYTSSPATSLSVDGQAVDWEASEEVGLFVAGVFVTMEPGQIRTIEVDVEGTTDLDDGYQLALWSPLTALRTPVTATVEIQGAPASPIEATLESTAGPATLVVPLVEQ